MTRGALLAQRPWEPRLVRAEILKLSTRRSIASRDRRLTSSGAADGSKSNRQRRVKR